MAISTDPLPVLRLLAERCASEQCRGRELGVAGPPLGAEHRYQWWGLRQIADDWVAATSPPFGVATVAALEILAEAGATRSVALHPTPQRGVLMIGPQSAAGVISDALGALAALGWVTSGDDRRRMVSACIGSRGCGASLIDTWHVAGELRPDVRTHVSGCEKRCGAPGGARHLVATATGLEEWPQ